MTQDEFLALVERHPLPWGLDIDGDVRDANDVRVDGVSRLMDAAPALAAAAIRLLRHGPPSVESPTLDEVDQYAAEYAALRAALPEALR